MRQVEQLETIEVMVSEGGRVPGQRWAQTGHPLAHLRLRPLAHVLVRTEGFFAAIATSVDLRFIGPLLRVNADALLSFKAVNVPDDHRLVAAARRQKLIVVGEGAACDVPLVALQAVHQRADASVPHDDHLVAAAVQNNRFYKKVLKNCTSHLRRGEQIAVHAELDAVDIARVADQFV